MIVWAEESIPLIRDLTQLVERNATAHKIITITIIKTKTPRGITANSMRPYCLTLAWYISASQAGYENIHSCR